MSIIRIAFSLAATLVLSASVTANNERNLDKRFEELAQTLESARQEAHVPGMSIVVVKLEVQKSSPAEAGGGALVWTKGFGLADIAAGRPADETTVYAIGSTTKAFTGLLVEMLADEGTLSLEDPVEKYLPYFQWRGRSPAIGPAGTPRAGLQQEDQVTQGAQVTLRDLLSHRHGYARMPTLYLDDKVSREDVLRTAAGAEPLGEFRKGFLYSNVGFLAAGEAAGVAANSSWDELMTERILEPLKMTSTTVSVEKAKKDKRLATGYEWDKNDERFVPKKLLNLDVIGPAGGVHSSVEDMARWLRFQLGRGELGGRRLVSRERFDETWAPQIEVDEGGSYGLGWILREYAGHKVVVHGGFMSGFSSIVALMPEEGFGYVLLMNLDTSPLQESSMGLVFDALLGESDAVAAPEDVQEAAEEIRPDPTESTFDLDTYAGIYVANFASFENEEFEIVSDAGELALDIPSQRIFRLLEPDDEGRWRFADTDRIAVSFQLNDQGAVVGLTVHQSGFSFQVPRQGVLIEPEVPIEELQKFAGTFLEVKQGRSMVISIERGGLFLTKGNDRLTLNPPDETGLATMRARPEFGIAFDVEADGTVPSLILKASNRERSYRRKSEGSQDELPSVGEIMALREAARVTARPEGEEGAHNKRADSTWTGTKATGKVWVAQAGLGGTFTTFTEGPSRYASHLDFDKFGLISRVVRDGEAFASYAMWGFEVLKGDELAQALLEHPNVVEGDWSKMFDEIKVIRKDTVNDRPVYVLRLGKGDLPSRSYAVDAETGDVLQVHVVAIDGSIRVPTTTTFSDYQLIEGVRRAKRVEAENPISGSMVLTLEEFDSGLELGPEVFVLEDSHLE